MTGINSVSSGMEGVQGIGPSPGKDSRLKVLEQKLAQLKGEKEKAVKNRDKEKVKELEKEIQKVEQQIDQLKRREKKGKKEENSQEAHGYMPKPVSDQVGREIDVYG